MATCQICKYSGTPSYKSPCSECKGFSKYEHEKKQTNADRIRAMSDDKLAEFLFGFECAKEKFGTQWDCQGEALEWLREPADQDDDEDERLPRLGRWVLLDVGVYAGSMYSVFGGGDNA